MTSLKLRLTHMALATATFATLGAGVITAGTAAADSPGNPGDPWPEPPSCSNVTGTCASMEDILAYECYFEDSNAPIKWCDNPLVELQLDSQKLAAPQAGEHPGTLEFRRHGLR